MLMKARSWKLEDGSWKMEVRSLKLESGSLPPDERTLDGLSVNSYEFINTPYRLMTND